MGSSFSRLAVRTLILVAPFVTVLPLSAEHALGGPAMDAYNRESKAHNDYYRGLRTLGPNATREQRRKLYTETVGKARVNTANVMGRITTEMGNSVRRKVHDELTKRMVAGVPRWILNPRDHGKSTASAGSSSGTLPTAPTPAPRAKKPETVLDGSNIPREIEFKPRSQQPQSE